MTENFQKMAKDINLQISDAQNSLNRKDSKKYIPTPVIITLLKTKSKDNILKTEKNHVSHIGEQQLEQLQISHQKSQE